MTAHDIAQMPIAERLKLMEALWDSLSVHTDRDYESPAWHESALRQAEADLSAGSAHFVEWDGAKELLRKSGKT